MNIKPIQTPNAPTAIGPYSQAIQTNGFIFCSGQVGINPETKTLAEGIEAQTHQVLKNLQAVLQAAETDLDNVIKTTIYLTNITDFAKVNEIYAQYFPQNKPARATVEVSNLPKGSLTTNPLIEIEAIAMV